MSMYHSAHGRMSRRNSNSEDNDPEDEPGFISSASAHGGGRSRNNNHGGGTSSNYRDRRPPQSARLPPSSSSSSSYSSLHRGTASVSSQSRPPPPRPAAVSPDNSGSSGSPTSRRGLSSDRPWRSQHGGGTNADDQEDQEGPGMITSASVHAGSSTSRAPASRRHQPSNLQSTSSQGQGQGQPPLSPFELMASDIEQRLRESKARLDSADSGSRAIVSPASGSNAGTSNATDNTTSSSSPSSSGLNSRWDHFTADPATLAAQSRSATGRAVVGLAAQVGGEEDHRHLVVSSDDGLSDRSGARLASPRSTTPSRRAPSSSSGGVNTSHMSPQDAIRLQAMQMLQLAGGPDEDSSGSDDGGGSNKRKGGRRGMGLSRNPRTGGYSAHPVGQRAHASISGLDGGNGRGGGGYGGGGYGEEVTVEEEPNVNAMLSSRGGGSPGSNDKNRNGKSSNWSSRYSVDRHLMFLTGSQHGGGGGSVHGSVHGNGGSGNGGNGGGGAASSMAPAARQVRDATSATGMYRASAYDMKSAGSSAGAASQARDYAHRNKIKVPRRQGQGQGQGNGYGFGFGSGWKTGLNLSDRSSLPEPPNNFHSGNYLITEEIRRKRRKRLCTGTVVLVALAAIVGAVYGTTFGGGDDADAYGSNAAAYWNVGEPVTFYVTSDVPYNNAEENVLSRDLSRLPDDAEFVVHLGDVGIAATTSCAESMYEDASYILKSSSRAPVFVLPGNQDWNECPNPDAAFDNWMQYFHRFEDNFSHRFAVTRQLGREENFSFLHNGVLFVGLNLVDGTVPDQTEWNVRHQECVQWAEQALNDFGPDEYRAVVLLGHARPTALLGDFFWPLINDINDINKPVLYVHGNAMQGWTVYKPFSDASRLKAIELEKGGKSPPVKIRVGMGADPFNFDRRSSNKA